MGVNLKKHRERTHFGKNQEKIFVCWNYPQSLPLCEIFHKLTIDFRAMVLTITSYQRGPSVEHNGGNMPSSDDQDRRQLGLYYAIAQVGFEMVVPIGLGWWADQQFNSAPWLLVLGVVLGFGLGIAHLVALTRNDGSKPPKDPKP